MGLLDDAIRDHLELKRRRGADPGEVAREEREALDVGPEPLDDSAFAEPSSEPTPEMDEPVAPSSSEGAETTVSGETAELDMRTVLGDEGDAAGEGSASASETDAPPEAGSEEDSLEWEMPERAAAAHRDETDARESVEEGPEDAHAGADEPVGDVLEETPDFLRDTPEQERMWFEQRPPRDFDFDK